MKTGRDWTEELHASRSEARRQIAWLAIMNDRPTMMGCLMDPS
jgi:hypothetical protein